MSKHTPGPWVVGNVGEVVAGGTTLADVYGDDEQADVDARLIAAAPDLLAALEDIARGDYSDPLCKRTPEQRAREAIAKVRGK